MCRVRLLELDPHGVQSCIDLLGVPLQVDPRHGVEDALGRVLWTEAASLLGQLGDAGHERFTRRWLGSRVGRATVGQLEGNPATDDRHRGPI